MNPEMTGIFKLFMVFIPLIFIAGVYCILVTRNLVRTLIGLEIVTKGVTLLIAVAGHVTGNLPLAQAMIVTLIVLEVVVIAVAAGVVLNIFRAHDSLDTRNLRSLQG